MPARLNNAGQRIGRPNNTVWGAIMTNNARELYGLDLFQAMYVVGLAFALQEISSALYKTMRKDPFGAFDEMLVFLAILLLIVRFFWSVGNIRRAIEKGQEGGSEKRDWHITLFHLPALLIQGTLILFISLSYSDFQEDHAAIGCVALLLIIATFWNLLWLYTLRSKRKKWYPEKIWILNNLVFVIFGLVYLLFATEAHTLSTSFLVIFFGISIISSGFDLSKTASHYVEEGSKPSSVA